MYMLSFRNQDFTATQIHMGQRKHWEPGKCLSKRVADVCSVSQRRVSALHKHTRLEQHYRKYVYIFCSSHAGSTALILCYSVSAHTELHLSCSPLTPQSTQATVLLFLWAASILHCVTSSTHSWMLWGSCHITEKSAHRSPNSWLAGIVEGCGWSEAEVCLWCRWHEDRARQGDAPATKLRTQKHRQSGTS